MDCCFFFFNDTATTEIYALPLHDALPICPQREARDDRVLRHDQPRRDLHAAARADDDDAAARSDRRQVVIQRSEEHTSELQSRQYLVCRLLLEKITTTC